MYIPERSKKLIEKKKGIAAKWRNLRTHVFADMAKKGGRLGKLGAKLDNMQNHLFENSGLYK